MGAGIYVRMNLARLPHGNDTAFTIIWRLDHEAGGIAVFNIVQITKFDISHKRLRYSGVGNTFFQAVMVTLSNNPAWA